MVRNEEWDDLPAWEAGIGWGASHNRREQARRSSGHRGVTANNGASPSLPAGPEDQPLTVVGGRAAAPIVTMNGTLRDLCERIRERLRDLQGK